MVRVVIPLMRDLNSEQMKLIVVPSTQNDNDASMEKLFSRCEYSTN